MQLNTTSPRPRVSDIASWMAAIFGVVLLLLLLLSFALETRTPASTPLSSSKTSGRIAYFEFGLSADTLWLASASDVSQREALLSVAHARQFGVVPKLSPDGGALAYVSLAPTASGSETAGDLWHVELKPDAKPRLVAGGADLRVAPVWSPDAERLVYRRSDTAGVSLVAISVDGGTEHVLATTSRGEALFPVGFAPDGETFYYVGLNETGSYVYTADASSASSFVVQLSAGLTREWTLSPDGAQIAYLQLTSERGVLNSRAYVMDLGTMQAAGLTDPAVDAFGPVWDSEGRLAVATLTANGEASLVRLQDGDVSQVLGPPSGFDVPLAYLPGGAFLVRSFEGSSATAPGRASLTFIDSSGERHLLSSREVTFAGWSAR